MIRLISLFVAAAFTFASTAAFAADAPKADDAKKSASKDGGGKKKKESC